MSIKKLVQIFLVCTASINIALAQTSIKLTIGATPGGATDILARAVQTILAEESDILLLLDYKPGVGGEIAYTHVANNRQEPNLLLVYQSLATLNVKSNRNYNWQQDLTMISYLGHSRLILLTGKQSGIASWYDIKNWPDNKPLSIGVTFPGSGAKMCGDFLMHHLKKDWTEVQYKSGAPAVIDLIGNHHQIGCHIEAAVRGYVESGLLTPLASIGNQRLTQYPLLASTQQFGILSNDLVTWNILAGNRLVDVTTINKIQEVLTNTMNNPKKRKRFIELSQHYIDAELTKGGTIAATKFVEKQIEQQKAMAKN